MLVVEFVFSQWIDNYGPGTARSAGIQAGKVECLPADHAFSACLQRYLPLDAPDVLKVVALASVRCPVADILPAAYGVVLVQVGVLQADVGACCDRDFGCLCLRYYAE